MRYRRLDPATGDYMFGGGYGDFWINQPEAVGQAALTRLMLWTGQWFYDTTEGTAWATQVLGERTQPTRDIVVRARVQGTPELIEIAAYRSVMNANTRSFAAAMIVNTAYGPAQVTVPTLPASVPPLPVAPVVPAHLLGIRPGRRTSVAATPADLTQSPRTDITQFDVQSMDAGSYP